MSTSPILQRKNPGTKELCQWHTKKPKQSWEMNLHFYFWAKISKHFSILSCLTYPMFCSRNKSSISWHLVSFVTQNVNVSAAEHLRVKKSLELPKIIRFFHVSGFFFNNWSSMWCKYTVVFFLGKCDCTVSGNIHFCLLHDPDSMAYVFSICSHHTVS